MKWVKLNEINEKLGQGAGYLFSNSGGTINAMW